MSVRDDVRSILSEHATVPDDDGAALDLDSLAIVQLVEALEDRFAIRVAPREVTPETFRSVASLVALVEGKRR